MTRCRLNRKMFIKLSSIENTSHLKRDGGNQRVVGAMLCVRVTVGRRWDGEMWASCKRVLVELKGTQIAGSHSLVVGTRGDTTQFLIM